MRHAAAGALLAHLARQLLGLLAELLLLPRQFFELPLQLLAGRRGVGELALPPAQLFLPAGKVADPVERALAVVPCRRASSVCDRVS